MSMLDNWLAAFDKRTPSPLYGKPLVYLIGAASARAIPGSVVEPPYGRDVPGTDDKIAYLNLFSRAEYGPAEPQFEWARRLYKFAELDNKVAYSIGDVQEATTLAHSYGLGVVAKNPVLTNGPLQFMAHPNVFGVIVERGAGTPATYDDLRKRARKDGLLPVWFVFDGPTGAQQCAEQIQFGKYKGMGVTYSTDRYNDSHTVLLPVV